MHTNKCLTNIVNPIKTLCVLLVSIFLLGITQMIIVQLYWEFSREYNRPTKPIVEQTEQEKQQWDIYNSIKAFAPDGTMYLTNHVTLPGTQETKFVVKNKDNEVLFKGKEEDNPYTFIPWAPKTNNSYHFNTVRQPELNELGLIGAEFSRRYVVPLVNASNKRIGYWIFNTDKRIFRYYSIAGEQIGCLGSNGYTEDISNASGFEECQRMENWLRPNSYDPIMLYQAENAIYQIDFQNKQVDTLVKTGDDPIRWMRLTNWQETLPYDYRPSLTVYTDSNKLYLHFKNPQQVIETQLPDDFTGFSSPMFAANEDTIFARHQEILGHPKTYDREEIIAWYMENRRKEKQRRIRLFEVNTDGTFTEKTSFTWIEPARQPNITYRTLPDMCSSFVNSLSSPVPMWATYLWFRMDNYRHWPVWSSETMNFIQAYSAFRTPVNLCVMTVLAILTFLHGWPRRTHIAKLIFWVVLVFLFNLPGFLTYLALNHTSLIHCANCGKKRGLMQDACCHCGTALPLPKLKETDLVMPLSA